MTIPDMGVLPRNDTELVRYAIRIGLVPGDVAELALTRFQDDGTAALTELIARGALDRDRVLALRDGQFDFSDRLGPYRLFEVLGHGGMGVVYRAHDPQGGEVAVKVLSPQLALDRVYQQRFLREAQAATSVSGPFVVRCRGAGVDDGRYWIAMELMRGGNAEDAADREGGRLPPERCLRLMRDAAEGLEAIHAAGLVHRDIKPGNLFLTEDGRAKLGDFGIARLPEEEGATRLTAIGRTLGTPGFMAPEQASAVPDLDIRADIYAIGATLYCLLTGQAPFVGSSNWLVMSQALVKPLPDPRDLALDCPPAVAAIVRGCGALRRDDRYLDPSLLRADIERVLAGEPPRHLPVAAIAAVAPQPAPPPLPRDRRILIVDDDPLLTRIQQARFQNAGWLVEVARDGESALASAARFAPSIVLLDLVLPDIDGAEVIRRLRRDPIQAHLPIVVLSNAYFAEELRAAREAGADLILSKVDHGPRQVLESIEHLLANDHGPRRQAAPIAEPPTGRIEGGLARSGKPALAAALRSLIAIGAGPDERGALLEVANHLRPLTGLSAAAHVPYAGTLASAAESLARLLHSWPRHLNASSLRTLRQVCGRLDQIFAGQQPPDTASARALVIDDDPVSRNTMLQALKKVNVPADACADASTALATVAGTRFDVVLCDADLAGMSGVDFASRIRADPRQRGLPVILVTGLADFDQVLRAEPGRPPLADDAIARPFLLMELAAKALVHLR